ncbi:MAG: 1-phosphofructokinase family hexose kinase [Sphingomonas sp.]|uniref:1-phosphofructokinase family hexose kinase n=1 Tax=Sphingomonas sp. TaxID=28214 RepID=UPI0025DFF7C2|nr:1-phosphofructokinase family hexose kinase [Sphingomonas sp.]MBX3564048.1 1-phosphofructokinase family hexose kinase [Sphingomonas sp.]
MIATLTLNPALDITTCTDKVRDTHKMRCTAPRLDPGGGGVNVARVVHALGGEVTAVFPHGGPAGETYVGLLREAGVPIIPVKIAGATRESFTVDEGETGLQYRFVLPGPTLSTAEIEALLEAIPAAELIVASGSLPPGCDPGIFRRLGALESKLIVDTSGPALAACEGAGIYLLKPSLREVKDLLGQPIESEDDELAAARTLRVRGFAEVIILSLAERGALLVADGVELRMPAVEVETKSAVGAGDSMVGAVTLALARGKSLADALRYGIAAGAATLMTPATELARPEDVERLYAASSP